MRLDHELKRPDGRVSCRNCAHDPGHARLCHLAGRHATRAWKRCGRYELADLRELARRKGKLSEKRPFIRLVVDNTRPGQGGDHPDGGPSRAA